MSSTIFKSVCFIGFVIVIQACGGGGSSGDNSSIQADSAPGSQLPPLDTETPRLSDGVLALTSIRFNNTQIELNESNNADLIEQLNEYHIGDISGTTMALSFTVADAEHLTTCSIDGVEVQPESENSFSGSILPAYLREEFRLECEYQPESADSQLLTRKVTLTAEKQDVSALFSYYLEIVPNYPLNDVNSAEIERVQRNYYYEINNLITLARIYAAPAEFALTDETELLQKLEHYLINTAEFYFQPCYDYDFETGPPASCRSENKVDGYYLWRSPLNNTEQYRSNHYKVEWRSAAGVAQAIKVLLKRHENVTETCLIADNPSQVRAQSISCRAKNIRRLIYQQVWQKWQSKIGSTDVMHYIAWLELILDMFQSTAHIEHDYNCTNNCYTAPNLASQMERILEFVAISGEYQSMTCRPMSESSQDCVWREYQLGNAGSNDLSHLAIPMYVFAQQNSPRVCNALGQRCFDRSTFIHTLKNRTWTSELSDVNGYLFPKFDMFLNGYCKTNYNNSSSSLQSYCLDYWVNETSVNNAHRELFGFVNFGAYDRELMLILLQAADANKDDIIDTNDVLTRGYVGFLYHALLNPQ